MESNYRVCSELKTQIGSEFSALDDGKGGEVLEHHEALRNDLTSVSYARRQIKTLLESFKEDLKDSAELLVSEVVTNALIHTAGDVTFNVKIKPDWVRVEIGDASGRGPRVKTAHVNSVSGRGLELVEALSSAWGYVTHGGGKIVWFELNEGSEADLTEEDLNRVVFRNAPARLVQKTILHSEETLREILIHSKSNSSGIDSYATLQEIELSELYDQTQKALTEGKERATLTLKLPSYAAGIALDILCKLEEADMEATEGNTLNEEASVDIKLCRRWILNEIVEQLSPNEKKRMSNKIVYMTDDSNNDSREITYQN